MNSMNKEELTEYADFLLKIAVYKAGNITDAEDIVQETMLAALTQIEKGGNIENPKSWLSAVLNRKYYDFLRRKYRKPVVCIDVVCEQTDDSDLFEKIEESEEAESIRRCLAMLTKNYREVMVRYYMKGEKLSDIASSLNIPLNTVKSRLYAGRRHMEKEFEMSNNGYMRQSYEPETLWIGCTGEAGLNGEPSSLVGNDKIKMNLLILAYEKPLTTAELASAIGIPTAYVEPIVENLVKGGLMGRVSDKVYTDFIIFSENDRTKYFDAQKNIADMNYREIWKIVDKGLAELREQDYYKSQRKSAKLKLESHFVIRTVQHAVYSVRNEACGGLEPFSDYAERPNGGKWYAIGNRYNKVLDNAESCYSPYGINGEWGSGIFDFLDAKFISLNEFDTVLCHAHRLYDGMTDKRPAIKMLYSVYRDNKDAFSAVDNCCIDKIDRFIEIGFLSRNEDGDLICEVPVISQKEREKHFEFIGKNGDEIAGKFHNSFMTLMEKPLQIPAHVKGYLKWLRYDKCCCYLPMMIILKAKEEGIYLKDIDKPEAAAYMVVEK